MFGLFKKKEKPADPQAQELRAFAEKFSPEEFTALVLTGPRGFASGKVEGESVLTGSIGLTAWLADGEEEVHQGNYLLIAKGDEKLMSFFQQRVPRDFILKCQVRLSLDGKLLLMTTLPEPGFDPDLKALLEQQKQPVTQEVEGLGTFTLNRSVGVLQGEVTWAGQPAQLCFDKDEDRAPCVTAAQTLLENSADWDAKARSLVADKLLEEANQWAADAEEEPVTRQDFLSRLGLETIDLSADGTFHLYYNDGDLFCGQLIHVEGTLSAGLSDARLEG